MREVCLVVPCFNEARRLPGDRFLELITDRADVSLCFVNDGSADGTQAVLDGLKARHPQRILVVSLAGNRGKAEAVRQGILQASSLGRFAVLGYWDADLSAPLGELDHLLAALDGNPSCLIALGSRVKRLGSDIDRRASRHFLGRIFSTFVSRLFDLAVYDSQCGAKIVRAELVPVLFGEPFATNWLFDVEILTRLRNHLGSAEFLKAAMEVPLTAWREVGGSKLRASHMARVPLDLLRIVRKYRSRP
jgi:glycosyltransferase involved in cell wall biosynthesis